MQISQRNDQEPPQITGKLIQQLEILNAVESSTHFGHPQSQWKRSVNVSL